MDKVNNNKSPQLKGKLKKKPNRTKTQYSNMNLIYEHSTVLTLCNLDRVQVGSGSKPTGPDKIGLADEESELAWKFEFFFFNFFLNWKFELTCLQSLLLYLVIRSLCLFLFFHFQLVLGFFLGVKLCIWSIIFTLFYNLVFNFSNMLI